MSRNQRLTLEFNHIREFEGFVWWKSTEDNLEAKKMIVQAMKDHVGVSERRLSEKDVLTVANTLLGRKKESKDLRAVFTTCTEALKLLAKMPDKYQGYRKDCPLDPFRPVRS